MLKVPGAISRDNFFEKLTEQFEGVYHAEKTFSLIVMEIIPLRTNLIKDYFSCVLQIIGKEIMSHLCSDSDYFAFWDNNFFVYSTVDNKNKIEDFIGYIAAVLKRDFQNDFILKAGFALYPYDAIDIQDLLDCVRDSKKKIDNLEKYKKLEEAPRMKKVKASNMEIMNEVHHYMRRLRRHDKYLFEHSMLVAQSSVYFAKELSLDERVVKNIAVSALLHDIGYLNIPSEIINKKGKLSGKEWGLIKLHPVLATRNILNTQPIFKEVLDIIERHHEFLDGSGYPFGLKGEDISVESQVLSMMDTYQAVITSRNYRRALSLDEVIDVFVRNAGLKWDDGLVTMFCAIIGDDKQRKHLTDKTFSKVSEIFEII